MMFGKSTDEKSDVDRRDRRVVLRTEHLNEFQTQTCLRRFVEQSANCIFS
jgi:hypothetical protein